MKTKGGIDVPADLASALAADAEVLTMWQRLRPSCQREHVASVLDAKRSDTRLRRVAAVIEATKEWNARHPRAARTVEDGRVGPILDELRAMGSEKNRAGMARYGINVENAFGVSVYELR